MNSHQSFGGYPLGDDRTTRLLDRLVDANRQTDEEIADRQIRQRNEELVTRYIRNLFDAEGER